MIYFLFILFPVLMHASDYDYSLQDYNSSSPSYNLDVWNPYYTDYITMHYFSSQGWAGWTATVGQLSDFQDELRNVYGYENVVIIAIGQSNISSFNSNFCAGQDLPLVMDQYPTLPIREMFSPYGQHKQLVILDYDKNVIGDITVSGVNNSVKSYVLEVIDQNYQQAISGDVNSDSIVNVQDIILVVNMILNPDSSDSSGDLNSDGIVNVLDVVQLVNIILS